MDAKKTYSKPAIASVNLIPDEAVLSGCKVAGSNGPESTGDNCAPLGTPCAIELS